MAHWQCGVRRKKKIARPGWNISLMFCSCIFHQPHTAISLPQNWLNIKSLTMTTVSEQAFLKGVSLTACHIFTHCRSLIARKKKGNILAEELEKHFILFT